MWKSRNINKTEGGGQERQFKAIIALKQEKIGENRTLSSALHRQEFRNFKQKWHIFLGEQASNASTVLVFRPTQKQLRRLQKQIRSTKRLKMSPKFNRK